MIFILIFLLNFLLLNISNIYFYLLVLILFFIKDILNVFYKISLKEISKIMLKNLYHYFLFLPTYPKIQKFFCFEVIDFIYAGKNNKRMNMVYLFEGYIILFIFFFESYFKTKLYFSIIFFTIFLINIFLIFLACYFTQQFILTQLNHFCENLDVKMNSQKHGDLVNTFLTPEEFYLLFPENTPPKWFAYENIKYFSYQSDLCSFIENRFIENNKLLFRYFIVIFLLSLLFTLLKYSFFPVYLDFILLLLTPLVIYYLPQSLALVQDKQKELLSSQWEEEWIEWCKKYDNLKKPWEEDK
jgi:hypothetical protein